MIRQKQGGSIKDNKILDKLNKEFFFLDETKLKSFIEDNNLFDLELVKKRIYEYIKQQLKAGKLEEFLIYFKTKDKINTNELLNFLKIIEKSKYSLSFDDLSLISNIESIDKVLGDIYKKYEVNPSFIDDNSSMLALIDLYCDQHDITGEDESLSLQKKLGDADLSTDVVYDYLRTIAKFPLLSREEEIALAKEVANNNKQAKDKFICSNLRLVVSIARKYTERGVEFIDLIQDGNTGLMKALDKFDPTKGYKFSTYATWWIRQAVTRSLANKSRSIRVPVHMDVKINAYIRAKNIFMNSLTVPFTNKLFAEFLNVNVEVIDNLDNFIKIYGINMASLNTKIDDDGTEFEALIADQKSEIEETSISTSLKAEIENLIDSKLSSKQADIIRKRFGIGDDNPAPMTLEQVGDIYGVTRERVRQIEAKALKKLEIYLKKNNFKIYIDESSKTIGDSKKKTKLSKKMDDYISILGSMQIPSNTEIIQYINKINNEREKNKELEQGDVVMKNDKKVDETERKVRKSLDNLYDYFDEYPEDLIDQVIAQLDDRSKSILVMRYGEDLKNPILNKEFSQESKKEFYNKVIPDMKRILKRLEKEKSVSHSDNIKDIDISTTDSESIGNDDVENSVAEKYPNLYTECSMNSEVQMIPNTKDVSKDESNNENYIRTLEIFGSEEFRNMTLQKPMNECVILALKLGYVDGKYFSSSSIANFLGVDVSEVDAIVKKTLVEYKEVLNGMIDKAIETETAGSKPYMKIIKRNNDVKQKNVYKISL